MVARLIHINGAPGVGKSTFARTFAARHPRVLALDADVVMSMLGGWQDHLWETLPLARSLAVAMAGAHLSAGYDVLLPQLVSSRAEIEPYLLEARAAGAQHIEILLSATVLETSTRFERRFEPDAPEIERQLADAIVSEGDWLLAKIRADLAAYLAGDGERVVVETTNLDAEATYAAVCAAADLDSF